MRQNSAGLTPIQTADRTEAKKIDVPVADSQLILNSAASGLLSVDTSLLRWT